MIGVLCVGPVKACVISPLLVPSRPFFHFDRKNGTVGKWTLVLERQFLKEEKKRDHEVETAAGRY